MIKDRPGEQRGDARRQRREDSGTSRAEQLDHLRFSRAGASGTAWAVARRIDMVQRVLVAGRGYLDTLSGERAAPRVPDDLRQHPCIVYTELATKNVWDFSTADGSHVAVRVDGPLQTNSSEVIRSSVLSGMGIGYSPTWLFDDQIASGDVQVLMADWKTKALPVQLVSPHERRHSAKVQAFGAHMAGAMTRNRDGRLESGSEISWASSALIVEVPNSRLEL
ncbi:MAG: hypothetical protein H7Y61_17530 [Rhizobiales bacterium]|nr:hypothetical protein [Rhizobacter sp.]